MDLSSYFHEMLSSLIKNSYNGTLLDKIFVGF
jgi:hypothetical protein